MSKYTETELEYFYKQAGYKPGDLVTVWGSKKHQIQPQTARVLEVGQGWVRVEAGIGPDRKTLELPWGSVGKDDSPLPRTKGTPKVHLTDKEKLEPLKYNGRIAYIIARGERPQGRINCHKFMVNVTTDTGRVIPAGTIATHKGTDYGYARYYLEDTDERVLIQV